MESMISVGQIKAARGLLEWNQSDLAKASGLHVNAINNVERRHGTPRVDTIELIQRTLENKGIKFKSLSGVELIQETLEIKKASGPDFIRVITDDTLLVVTTPDDEVLVVIPDDFLFKMDIKEDERYYREKKKRGFKHRIIITKEDGNTASNQEEVRFLPEALTGKISYQIYKDRFVLINWDAPEAIIIRSASLAESFRRQFNYLWDQAAPFKKKK